MTKEPKNKQTDESEQTIEDVEARQVVERLDSYQDYQREFRSNHLTSDEY